MSFHQITIQKWNPILSSWQSVIELAFLKRVASSDFLELAACYLQKSYAENEFWDSVYVKFKVLAETARGSVQT